jgi:hypothetical protein
MFMLTSIDVKQGQNFPQLAPSRLSSMLVVSQSIVLSGQTLGQEGFLSHYDPLEVVLFTSMISLFLLI